MAFLLVCEQFALVGALGFEPKTSCVSSRRSAELSYAPQKWRGREDLNPHHLVLETSVFPFRPRPLVCVRPAGFEPATS